MVLWLRRKDIFCLFFKGLSTLEVYSSENIWARDLQLVPIAPVKKPFFVGCLSKLENVIIALVVLWVFYVATRNRYFFLMRKCLNWLPDWGWFIIIIIIIIIGFPINCQLCCSASGRIFCPFFITTSLTFQPFFHIITIYAQSAGCTGSIFLGSCATYRDCFRSNSSTLPVWLLWEGGLWHGMRRTAFASANLVLVLLAINSNIFHWKKNTYF